MAKQVKVLNKANGKSFTMDAGEATILKSNKTIGKNFAYEASEEEPEKLKTTNKSNPTE